MWRLQPVVCAGTVTPIDVATNKAGPPIKIGATPAGIVFTPDSKTAYVMCPGSVTPIAPGHRQGRGDRSRSRPPPGCSSSWRMLSTRDHAGNTREPSPGACHGGTAGHGDTARLDVGWAGDGTLPDDGRTLVRSLRA